MSTKNTTGTKTSSQNTFQVFIRQEVFIGSVFFVTCERQSMWLNWVYLVLFFQRPIASSSYLKEERQKITLVREKRVCVADLCVCVAPGWLPIFFSEKTQNYFVSGFVFLNYRNVFRKLIEKCSKLNDKCTTWFERCRWNQNIGIDDHHIPVESTRLFFVLFLREIVWRKKK